MEGVESVQSPRPRSCSHSRILSQAAVCLQMIQMPPAMTKNADPMIGTLQKEGETRSWRSWRMQMT
ncbi:hypothetical protein CVT25_001807 [Psilocybe cyanescens]|uniref:Uncharacterized protein n=1 Tax=Psilocybe cyanescens TaxID=93625 RepID=A0A409W028_PSICY|nr:hypothetical protein CVT25_001807 [Psilocybe cyanescens]